VEIPHFREELCQKLNVCSRTLSRMILRGDIPPPAFRSGKTVRWRLDQFPSLLSKSRDDEPSAN
jgi:predicted site-specific integrase-resolvase